MEHSAGHVRSVTCIVSVHSWMVPDLVPIRIAGDCEGVGGLPVTSHNGQAVGNQLPLDPRRPWKRCWQVHSPSTASTFGFDSFIEYAPCSNPSLEFTLNVLELAVFNTAEHVHQVLFQQSSQHSKRAVSEDPLPVELDLTDFVVWWTERVEVDVIPRCSMWKKQWVLQRLIEWDVGVRGWMNVGCS